MEVSMNLHNVRELLKKDSIYNIDMRVTFYARVSSESDEQLNSLDNQIGYYENFITKNAKWKFVDGYIDEGISGVSTKNRKSFHEMIDDGKNGKFDLIITKEISRFARNTVDSLFYTRELLSSGVGVLFQNDNINTFDEDSELRLSIMSSIAQDELRKLSSRIKFGHQQAIKNGVVLGNSKIFGYRKDHKRLVIDENEAKMVRELFELYSSDRYSMKNIEDIFWERGYRNTKGNKISHTTMSNMISNPKYKGYYAGNKVKNVDMFTKQRIFLPQDEWVMYKDDSGEIVPQIVSEDIWDAANKVLAKRSTDVKQRQGICNHANLLTGKLFCAHCNAPYYRKDSRRKGCNNSSWVCSKKIQNGKDSCPSIRIYEDEIKAVLYDCVAETKVDVNGILDEFISIYKNILDDSDVESEIKKIKASLDLEEKKKNKLLEYNVTGKINDQDYLSMNKTCDYRISELNQKLLDLQESRISESDITSYVSEVRKTLIKAQNDARVNIVDKEFIDSYIDKIYVSVDNDDVILDIRLISDTGNRSVKLLKGRTGQTSKKICPVQLMNITRCDRTKTHHKISINYQYYVSI